MKNLHIVIFLILWSSCKSPKEYIERTSEIKNDSVYIKTESKVSAPILSSLTIEEVCDTVTGKAKEFKQRFVIDQDTMELHLKNNRLEFNVSQLEDIISKKDSIIKSRSSVKESTTEVTITKYVWTKWTWIFLGGLLLCIAFPIVPKFINGLGRKLVGLF